MSHDKMALLGFQHRLLWRVPKWRVASNVEEASRNAVTREKTVVLLGKALERLGQAMRCSRVMSSDNPWATSQPYDQSTPIVIAWRFTRINSLPLDPGLLRPTATAWHLAFGLIDSSRWWCNVVHQTGSMQLMTRSWWRINGATSYISWQIDVIIIPALLKMINAHYQSPDETISIIMSCQLIDG